MADYGYTFQPGGDQTNQTDRSGGQGRIDPQEAIRILSFRVPKQPIAGAFAPQALLPGAGQQSADASALNLIVGALMQSMRAARPSLAQMPVGSGGGGGAVSFLPGGSAGPVVPQESRATYPTPTFKPGGETAIDRQPVQDLFGNEISREGSGGGKTIQEEPGGSFGDWVRRENVLNGRLPSEFLKPPVRF